MPQIQEISKIEPFKIGHAQDFEAATGCTVIVSKEGVRAGVDVRGGAPGTRETDLLRPENLVQKIHAVILTGGSAFGLEAASGVMQYLEEQQVGFEINGIYVPIVCGAVLFDLFIGQPEVRPGKAMGYQACVNAETSAPCRAGGNVGAGTGAVIGKIRGIEYALKGGLGMCCLQVEHLQVGAVVAVNCFGDVCNPQTGHILAGALNDDKRTFADTEETLLTQHATPTIRPGGNTTLGVVMTNATLSKAQAAKVAGMAHNGYARTIRPAHSLFDGDTIFTLAAGEQKVDVSVVGILAARVIEQAVIRAVKQAAPLCGVRCYADLHRGSPDAD